MKKCILDMNEQELREEYERHCAADDDDPIVELPTTRTPSKPRTEEQARNEVLASLAYGEPCTEDDAEEVVEIIG